MPFYELVCISRILAKPSISSLLRTTAATVLDNGGTVRQLINHGEGDLPFIMKRHGKHHSTGLTWFMHFDANPATVATLDSQLRLDPRVIRSTVVKVGEKLEDVIKYPSRY